MEGGHAALSFEYAAYFWQRSWRLISLGLNPLTKDKAPANDKEQDVETYAKGRRKSKKQSMSSSLSSECVVARSRRIAEGIAN